MLGDIVGECYHFRPQCTFLLKYLELLIMVQQAKMANTYANDA